jgi:hypothetical protein
MYTQDNSKASLKWGLLLTCCCWSICHIRSVSLHQTQASHAHSTLSLVLSPSFSHAHTATLSAAIPPFCPNPYSSLSLCTLHHPAYTISVVVKGSLSPTGPPSIDKRIKWPSLTKPCGIWPTVHGDMSVPYCHESPKCSMYYAL